MLATTTFLDTPRATEDRCMLPFVREQQAALPLVRSSTKLLRALERISLLAIARSKSLLESFQRAVQQEGSCVFLFQPEQCVFNRMICDLRMLSIKERILCLLRLKFSHDATQVWSCAQAKHIKLQTVSLSANLHTNVSVRRSTYGPVKSMASRSRSDTAAT